MAKMDEKAIFEKIKSIIVQQLDVPADEVTPVTSFEDLNADSLDVVELIMALEEEFDLEIPDEVAEKFSNVGATVEYIKENQ
jgi:acyl carrier protein